MKHYSTKELLEASNKAPAPVQEALSSEMTITTISNLGTNLKLHIDQIGLIAELNVQMLLGLVNPQEFLNELIAAKIPENDAKAIITEINQKIFVPLREKMMGGGKTAVPQPAGGKSASSQAGAPATPVAGGTSNFHLENKLPPRPIAPGVPSPRPIVPPRPPMPPAGNMPRPQNPGLRDALATVTKSIPPPAPNRMLEDHEEPHIEFHKTPVVPAAPRPPVVPAMQRPATPPRPAASVNLPGAMPPHPASVAGPAPVAPRPLPPIPPPPPMKPSAPAKPYAVDPYREPIEP